MALMKRFTCFKRFLFLAWTCSSGDLASKDDCKGSLRFGTIIFDVRGQRTSQDKLVVHIEWTQAYLKLFGSVRGCHMFSRI